MVCSTKSEILPRRHDITKGDFDVLAKPDRKNARPEEWLAYLLFGYGSRTCDHQIMSPTSGTLLVDDWLAVSHVESNEISDPILQGLTRDSAVTLRTPAFAGMTWRSLSLCLSVTDRSFCYVKRMKQNANLKGWR